MIGMKTNLCSIALLWILIFISIPVSAQTKKEKREKRKEAVKEIIVSENYKITVSTAIPMSGRTVQLTSPYSISVRNDSIISYLPYYGRAYSIPYGGGDGLIFKAPILTYSMKTTKKGNADIKFTARSPEDKFDFKVTVSESGYANIQVTMQNRQSITFYGTLDMKDKE